MILFLYNSSMKKNFFLKKFPMSANDEHYSSSGFELGSGILLAGHKQAEGYTQWNVIGQGQNL